MQEGHYCEHGEDAFSYNTCIRTEYKNYRIYNVTSYSNTTSRHQAKAFNRTVKELRAMQKAGEINRFIVLLDDVPRGVDADELRALGKAAIKEVA